VSSGRIAEGFAVLPGGDGVVDPTAMQQEGLFALMATANAAVQVGDTELAGQLLRLAPSFRLGGSGAEEVRVGDIERSVATALHQLQLGESTNALQVLESLHRALPDEGDSNARSALALAHVAGGDLEGALLDADAVVSADQASYLDKVFAGIARGLALSRRGDHAAAQAAFDQVKAAADATEDRISWALTRLADATAASARGEADAAQRCEEADRHLAELGLLDTGWRRAFSLALGEGVSSSPA
jgi:tetratricopeptide (TPR) repeat protein